MLCPFQLIREHPWHQYYHFLTNNSYHLFWHCTRQYDQCFATSCHYLYFTDEDTKLNGQVRIIQPFAAVQSLSCVRLFATPWTAALQAALSFTVSQNLHRFMCLELAMPSNRLILCHPFLLLPSIFPIIMNLFQWVSSSHQAVKVVQLKLEHQFFQWLFRVDFF